MISFGFIYVSLLFISPLSTLSDKAMKQGGMIVTGGNDCDRGNDCKNKSYTFFNKKLVYKKRVLDWWKN